MLEQATKEAQTSTNGCDEMSFAAAFKTTKNPNVFHEFSRQVKLAGEMISHKCSAVCTQCHHHSTFHLRHSWKNMECPILSKQAKPRLTSCHSPTHAFKLICSIKKSEDKDSPSPKQKFLSFEPLARSFLSLELSSARANFKNYPKMTNLKKGIT